MIALVILSAFTIVYEYRGIRVSNESGATDFKFRSGDLKSTMVEGFAWFKEDADGFNNMYFLGQNSPDILLMGSSHMEARQIFPEENVCGLLNKMQGDFSTYNIGMSGHSIYRCIDNIQDAVDFYKPNKFIIIETDKVNLDIEEMNQVLSGSTQEVPFYNAGFINQLQKIPAIKLLYTSFVDWLSQDKESDAPEDREEDIRHFNQTDYSCILEQFLGKAKLAAGETDIIIFYHPSQILEQDGSIVYETDQTFLNIFMDSCQKNGITFVDVTERFKFLYEEEKRLAYGFSNTGVGEGHLNKYGHKAIAEQLSEVIDEMEEK